MGELKVQSGTLIVILIIVSLILISWVGGWECLNNSDCNSDEVCTVKHTCYKPAIPEKTVYITETKYAGAAIILGIAIILAAIILSKKNLNFKKK